jgi:hypothetical protein
MTGTVYGRSGRPYLTVSRDQEVQSVRLYTSRYQNAKLSGRDDLVKVRTTVGNPRGALGAGVVAQIKEVTPYGLFGQGLSQEEFTARYRERLEGYGVEKLRQRFAEVSQAHGGKDLVLLCFEDVLHPGKDGRVGFCHRRVFADWWQEKTDEPVEELDA